MQEKMKQFNRLSNAVDRFKLVELLSRNRNLNMTQNQHVYAICCRSNADGDVISGRNVKTIEDNALVNFQLASLKQFPR